jgi:hypothetical protein
MIVVKMANILTWAFEKLPERPYKNKVREFLAFSKWVPKFVQDLSPIKGYELHRKLREGDYVIDSMGDRNYNTFKLKLTNNEISILTEQKQSYSREEVVELLKLAWATASAYGDNTDEADCLNWIKDNLK